jgi:hypothetical protein
MLAPGRYTRWLTDEPDPRDLIRHYPAGPMRMWLISTRVNEPENDDQSNLEPVDGLTRHLDRHAVRLRYDWNGDRKQHGCISRVPVESYCGGQSTTMP